MVTTRNLVESSTPSFTSPNLTYCDSLPLCSSDSVANLRRARDAPRRAGPKPRATRTTCASERRDNGASRRPDRQLLHLCNDSQRFLKLDPRVAVKQCSRPAVKEAASEIRGDATKIRAFGIQQHELLERDDVSPPVLASLAAARSDAHPRQLSGYSAALRLRPHAADTDHGIKATVSHSAHAIVHAKLPGPIRITDMRAFVGEDSK